MLLTETIKNSTSAIKKYRTAAESKQSAETYAKALVLLVQTATSIQETLKCAIAMKESKIVDTPLLDEIIRNDLLTCINDCGNGVSEMKLTLDIVKLLKSKGDEVTAHVKNVWKDAAQRYSDGSKGYLSIIGGLSENPGRAKELVDSITRTVADDPSIKAIKSLISNVNEANQIVSNFSLNPEIEIFLKKVAARQATIADLTPNVLIWLKEKKLTGKIQIRF